MLIHVLPGEIHGIPLALTNELHAVRYRRTVTALVDAGDDTPATRLARDWARQCNIPTVSHQRPDLIVIPIDMAGTFGDYEGPAKGLFMPQAQDAWNKALSQIQPRRPGPLRRLLNKFQGETLWVNTTHADYNVPAQGAPQQ